MSLVQDTFSRREDSSHRDRPGKKLVPFEETGGGRPVSKLDNVSVSMAAVTVISVA